MPGTPTYPGVYIEEVPSGVRTIVGVATSTTAFIGRARRGPVNEPQLINSFGDFERGFGGLWRESTLSYAVRDFYRNGGSQAIIVRVYHPRFETEANRNTALAAAQDVADHVVDAAATADSVADAAREKVGDYTGQPDAVLGAAETVAVAAEVAARAENATAASVSAAAAAAVSRAAPDYGAGEQADALDAVTDAAGVASGAASTVDPVPTPQSVVAAVVAFAQAETVPVRSAAALTVAEAAVLAGSLEGATPGAVEDAVDDAIARAAPLFNAGQREVALEAAQAVADDAAAEASTLQAVADAASAAAAAYAEGTITRTAADVVASAVNAASTRAGVLVEDLAAAAQEAIGVAAPITRAKITYGTLRLEAINEGEWGNDLRIRVDWQTKADPENLLFNLSVSDGTTGNIEVIRNVSVQQGQVRQLDKVLEKESHLVRVVGNLPVARPAAHPVAEAGKDPFDPDEPTSAGVLAADRASDGVPPEQEDYEGNEAKKEGIYALEKADLVNLLCIPPPVPERDLYKPVWSTALAYCLKRRAMLIVDSPSGWTDKTLAKNLDDVGLADDGARNAALFFPRFRQPNPEVDGQVEEFVPCGAVAGVFARMDAQRGVWKSPAGIEATLSGVPELSVSLTDAENGELNPLGVNCLRAFVPAGRVIWGSRTLRGDDRLASEWKYIPVRRMALFLEESLYRGTQWVVFEPNDEPLWSQIRLNIGSFMHGLFRQGAFQGSTPGEAYFVKCDKETTTQDDIDRGIVNILVGFAPLKPAEFVIIKISQKTSQQPT